MQGITRIEKRIFPFGPWTEGEDSYSEIWFCDRVRWEENGAMVTGPIIYARRHDGTWVVAANYSVLLRTGGTPCVEPDGLIDFDAKNRMQGHFRSLGIPDSAAMV